MFLEVLKLVYIIHFRINAIINEVEVEIMIIITIMDYINIIQSLAN